MDIIYYSAKNIVERPIETAIAAAVIGLGVTYTPQIIKFVNGKVRKNKGRR